MGNGEWSGFLGHKQAGNGGNGTCPRCNRLGNPVLVQLGKGKGLTVLATIGARGECAVAT
jgi:hypothetical protein